MNTIIENAVALPDRRTKSGALRKQYSNILPENSSLITVPTEEEMLGTTGTGTTSSGSNAMGWVNTISGAISSVAGSVSSIWNTSNEGKYGTTAYNQALAAQAQSKNSTTDNKGLVIAISVVGVVLLVGIVALIAKKK